MGADVITLGVQGAAPNVYVTDSFLNLFIPHHMNKCSSMHIFCTTSSLYIVFSNWSTVMYMYNYIKMYMCNYINMYILYMYNYIKILCTIMYAIIKSTGYI